MFDKAHYGRVLVPVLTPYGHDQEVDLDAFTGLIDFLVTNDKADSLIFSGTTGEFHTQTFDERVQIFRTGREAAAGRIPTIAGIGCASTPETIALGRQAVELGYETVMIVAPYYAKPSQAELLGHYQRVAAALPSTNIILYNIPIFTGVNLSPEVVGELARVPNIVAIKDEAELNPKQITQYLNATPDDFVIYNGDDTMILETYAQGGVDRVGGVVSGASHLFGDVIRTMIDRFVAGDVAEAARTQAALYPVFKVMSQGGRTNPAALWKDAMRLAGVDAGIPRLPMTPGTDDEVANIKRALVQFGAL